MPTVSVDMPNVKECDIALLDPKCYKKLKKAELIDVLTKYDEIMRVMRERNNNAVEMYKEAHTAFAALCYTISHADTPEEITRIKESCSKLNVRVEVEEGEDAE